MTVRANVRSLHVPIATAVCLAVFLTRSVQTQNATPVLSPGVVGLVAIEPPTAANESLLLRALASDQPLVRAAAARVAFTQGRRGLTDAVMRAVQRETDGHAAVEEARFLAAFGSNNEPTLLNVATRVPSVGHQIALLVARAKGPSALAYLPQFRAVHADVASQAEFIRIASRGETAPVEALLASAAPDVELIASVLASARRLDAALSDGALIRLLAEGSTPEVRVAAMAHLVVTRGSASALSDQLRLALAEALRSTSSADDPGTVFVAELVRRLWGAAARIYEAWTSMLTQRAEAIRNAVDALGAYGLPQRLSEAEYAAFTRALYGRARRIGGPAKPKPRQVQAARALMRLLSGHPPGFAASIIDETKCRMARHRNTASGGRASYRPDGRVAHMSLASVPSSRECARAVEALLLTYVVEPERPVPADDRDVLVFPFQTDFVACQDTLPAAPPIRWLFEEADVAPPQPTKHADPIYPRDAYADRVSGLVLLDATLGTTGCVAAASVTESVDARLDWEALRTVSGWRFTPARVNGSPAASFIKAEIEFNLK